MNFGTIRSTAQNNGRFDTTQDTQMKDWVIAAYSWVWNAADWQFKKVTEANLSIVSGTDKPTLPSDFGDKLEVWDQFGTPLIAMDEREYDDYYRADKANGVTGQPEAFKVVNRTLYLSPTPSITATFKCNYTRAISTYQSDGVTVRPGGFASASAVDTDVPLWDANHHQVLVWKTMEIGGSAESDISGIMWSETANDLLAAMVTDLAGVKKAPRQWGRPYR